MATTHQITTAEQLLQAPDLGRCELLRGELVMMSPAGFEHGRIIGNITGPLATYVRQKKLGVVAGAETGFQIARDPDTVRAPDVAVEVLSPTDRAGELLAKVHEWLAAGCRAVWVVDPGARTVSVYRRRD